MGPLFWASSVILHFHLFFQYPLFILGEFHCITYSVLFENQDAWNVQIFDSMQLVSLQRTSRRISPLQLSFLKEAQALLNSALCSDGSLLSWAGLPPFSPLSFFLFSSLLYSYLFLFFSQHGSPFSISTLKPPDTAKNLCWCKGNLGNGKLWTWFSVAKAVFTIAYGYVQSLNKPW